MPKKKQENKIIDNTINTEKKELTEKLNSQKKEIEIFQSRIQRIKEIILASNFKINETQCMKIINIITGAYESK